VYGDSFDDFLSNLGMFWESARTSI